ncbi:MAG TPA: hypothetical protein VMV69_25445 [Pirellulales bacterium]|nr:hypothetical protein [Pirellulales bacterium]
MKLRIAVGAACLVALVAGGFLAWGYWAATRVPHFYRESLKLHPEAQQVASDQLLETATALASNVRKEGRWQALFTSEQINGWLAVDLARNFPDTLPPGVVDPRVQIRPEGVTVACRYLHGAVATVMSLDAEIYMQEPNVLSVRLHNARAGAIPVPMGEILDGVQQAATEAEFQLTWQQAEGDPVALVRVHPPRDDEDTLYVLETLELRDGALYVAGRTTRGNSEGSPTWDPGFKPVALAPSGEKENRQR